MTVDSALKILQKAKKELGGNACLILSLTDSNYADVIVNNMKIIKDGDNNYVEVKAICSLLN